MAESSNANAMVSGLKVSDILLPHPSLPNSLCLGPRIADALSLSLSPLEKHENLLKTIGYFWSDALNCFMFGHGPMTPTLLDVAMITAHEIIVLKYIGEINHIATGTAPSLDGELLLFMGAAAVKMAVEMAACRWRSLPGHFPVRRVPEQRLLSPDLGFTMAAAPEGFASSGSLLQELTIPEKGYDAEPADFTEIGSQEQGILGASCPPSLNPGEESSFCNMLVFLLQTSTEENSSEETQSSRRDSSSGNSGRTTTQSQTDLPSSASKKRSAPEPAAFQAPIRAGLRTKSRCVKRAHKEPRASSPSHETDETSSGDVEEILMPSATLDLATSKSAADKVANLAKPTEEPIITASAVPPVLGEGYDLLSLLTFDPESIEPATSRAGEEPRPSTTHGQLQSLKALLSSPVETLVENPEEVKGILEDIQPHLPVTLQVKLWPAVTLSAFSQLVTGKDEDDKAEIAEVDRIRADALHALNVFLQ
ncbi:hypothetical protein QYE76_049502 [Lolium multiflorum]|uniref:Uncharacterized protein n=1 Tax=Lolium multiflorum TaxID=4521 RepID=A0AAD8WIE6_LOLMU|nr:hypothetical protein QYE76_049502 [Lolium multiflorum]